MKYYSIKVQLHSNRQILKSGVRLIYTPLINEFKVLRNSQKYNCLQMGQI